MAVLGSDVRLTCSAASSSSSPITFAWRKDQEPLRHAETENSAQVRGGGSPPGSPDGGVVEHTTVLHLRRVTFAQEGRYQCIITNHFGSTYSNKARLVVNGGLGCGESLPPATEQGFFFLLGWMFCPQSSRPS